MAPFLAWRDFHARSRFARSAIPEEKWGTTRSLIVFLNVWHTCFMIFYFSYPSQCYYKSYMDIVSLRESWLLLLESWIIIIVTIHWINLYPVYCTIQIFLLLIHWIAIYQVHEQHYRSTIQYLNSRGLVHLFYLVLNERMADLVGVFRSSGKFVYPELQTFVISQCALIIDLGSDQFIGFWMHLMEVTAQNT